MRDIILIDLETTGFEAGVHDPAGQDPVQLAAIRLDGETLEETAAFVSRVRPERPENARASALEIHGLSLEELSQAPVTRDVLRGFESAMFGAERALSTDPDVLDQLKDEITLAGQYLHFDLAFLDLMYRRVGMHVRRLGRDELDTRVIARLLTRTGYLETEDGDISLDAQRDALGMRERTGAHDALEDVRMTADVLRAHESTLRSVLERARSYERLARFVRDAAPELMTEFERQGARPTPGQDAAVGLIEGMRRARAR